MRAKKKTIEWINGTTSRFLSKINLDLQHNHSTKVMHQVMETFKKDNFNQSHKNTWICVNGIVECKVSHKSSSRMLERSLWQAALTREGAFFKIWVRNLGCWNWAALKRSKLWNRIKDIYWNKYQLTSIYLFRNISINPPLSKLNSLRLPSLLPSSHIVCQRGWQEGSTQPVKLIFVKL